MAFALRCTLNENSQMLKVKTLRLSSVKLTELNPPLSKPLLWFWKHSDIRYFTKWAPQQCYGSQNRLFIVCQMNSSLNEC